MLSQILRARRQNCKTQWFKKVFFSKFIHQLLPFVTWIDHPNGGHLSPGKVTYNTQKRPLGRTWQNNLPNLQLLKKRDIESIGYLHPWKINMSPENQWLEDVFPIEMVPFLVDMLILRQIHPGKLTAIEPENPS